MEIGTAQTALIGRRRELGRFADLREQLERGGSGYLWITGEAGSGKSRFLEACVRQAAQAGWEVLQGACTEETLGDPYGPFLSVLGLCFDRGGRLINDRSVYSIVDQISLDDVFGAVSDIPGMSVVAFGLKVGMTIFESRRRPQSSDDLINRNFEFILQLFKQIGNKRKKPILIALDDLHLASTTTYALVEYLLTRIEGTRLLVLATWQAGAAGEGRVRVREVLPRLARPEGTIHLAPLSDHQLRRLLQRLCTRPMAGELASALVQFSRGLPGPLVESGRLVELAGAPEAGDGRGVEITHLALQSLIARQLDRLAQGQRTLLECASLLGQRLPLSMLSAPPLCAYLGMSERAVLAAVVDLADRGFVLTWDGEDAVRFTSPFAQEFLREQAREPVASRDHLRIAEAWQATGDESHPAALAQHYLIGKDWDRALTFALRSAEELSRSAAYPEAVQSYRLALEAFERSPRADRDEVKYGILRAMALAAEQTGNWSEALARMEEALALSPGQTAREAEVCADLGWLHCQRGEVQSALQHLDRSAGLYRSLDDARGQAQVDYYLGVLYGQQKEWQRAISCFERYLETTERAGLSEGRASAYIELGNLYRLQQGGSQAETFLQQGIDLARAEDDAIVLAQGYHYLGNCYARQGKPEAIDVLHRALGIVTTRTRQPAQQARIQNTLAEALVRMNRWQEAEAAFHASAEIKERLGDVLGLAMTYGGLGRLYFRQWRFDQAVAYLQRDVDLLSQEFEVNVAWIQQHTNSIGEAHRLQGQLDEAERCFASALSLAGRIPDDAVREQSQAYTRLLLARLALDRGDTAAAGRDCAWALERLGGTWAEGEAHLTAARLARTIGEMQEARSQLDQALAIVEERGEDIERALCYLERARFHHDAGDGAQAGDWAGRVVALARRLQNVEMERQASQLLPDGE